MRSLQNASGRRLNYATFDGLRGFAAVAVVLYHMAPSADITQIMPHGYLAVDLFFVLSGFVIAQAYGARLKDGMSLRMFMVVRLVRLYPLYFLGQVLGLGILAVSGHETLVLLKAFAMGIFMMPLPVDIKDVPLIFPLNSPSWSLFFEISINLAFVFLVTVSPKKTLYLIAASSLVVAATALRFGNLDVGWNVYNFVGGFPRVAFSFLVGVFLVGTTPGVRKGNHVPVLIMAAVLVILAAPYQSWWFDLIIVLLVFPVIVFAAAVFQPTGAVWWVSCRLGRISYPIYIIHAPLLHLGALLIKEWNVSSELQPLAWAATLTTILVLSEVAVTFYDQPVRRALPHVLNFLQSFKKAA